MNITDTKLLVRRMEYTQRICRTLAILEGLGFSFLFYLHQIKQIPIAKHLGWWLCACFVIGFILLGRINVRHGKALEDIVQLSSEEARQHTISHLTHITAPMLISAFATFAFS